jgi:predicted Zn-dependent protease
VGAANHDLVSGKAYPKLYVEIDSPPGAGPNAEALTAFHDALAQVSGRAPGNVVLDTSDTSIPADAGHRYTVQEIADLESQHRSHHTGGDTAALYVIYVAGGSDGDSGNGKVLGEAYRGTSLAMFKGNVRSTSSTGGLSTKPSELCVERAVIIHEFGHAAGLVNLGTPMQAPHEDSDPAHRGHSSSQGSVMYWAVDGSASLTNLLTPLGGGCEQQIPWHFDDNDLADLRALAAS